MKTYGVEVVYKGSITVAVDVPDDATEEDIRNAAINQIGDDIPLGEGLLDYMNNFEEDDFIIEEII